MIGFWPQERIASTQYERAELKETVGWHWLPSLGYGVRRERGAGKGEPSLGLRQIFALSHSHSGTQEVGLSMA